MKHTRILIVRRPRVKRSGRIYIVRRVNGWLIRTVAPNGETLSSTELIDESRNALKNMRAQKRVWRSKSTRFQLLDERPPRAKKARRK